MKNIIKVILFNVLVILTVVLIFLLFFPKKSYVDALLDNELNPIVDEVFTSNINSMKIASINFFENNDSKKVSLRELIDNGLLVDLNDSKNEKCDPDSFALQTDDKLVVSLKCSDKEDKVEFDLGKKDKKKMFCLYEYVKEFDAEYSDWSEWSSWSKDERISDDLTNVESKIEKEENGTRVVLNTLTESVEAERYVALACPDGYIETDGRCKKVVESNSISASIKYTCPSGYSRNGLKCYSGNSSVDATKIYYCPSNNESTEFVLSGSECKTYNVKNIYTSIVEYRYRCESGYYLDGDMCYKDIQYEEEVTDYVDVTYYRYQTRERINKKIDVIWSSKDNKDLLSKSYNVTREISCEF